MFGLRENLQRNMLIWGRNSVWCDRINKAEACVIRKTYKENN